jgi:ligand-binding sensor domain-containing protein
MKQYLTFSFSFLLFVISCNGQDKKELPKKSNLEPQGIPFLPNYEDIDPYFRPVGGINSPFGPRDITRNILEDKNGTLWFASWNGIIGYDGKVFTNYTNKEHLRRYHVFSICEEKKSGKNSIWFGTIGAGAYRYDGSKFTNFTTKNGLTNDIVGCILEDKLGNVWFGTSDGISCFDGKTFRNFTEKDGLVGTDFNSIIEDKNGTLWFASRSGVTRYNGNAFTAFKNKENQDFNNVRSLLEDNNGNIWIGGQDGLVYYDGKNLTEFTKAFIGFLYEDRKGTIYISAGTPSTQNMVLYRYDGKIQPSSEPSLQAVFTTVIKEKGQVYGIFEDKNGYIWYGRERGVQRFDGNVFTDFLEKKEK